MYASANKRAIDKIIVVDDGYLTCFGLDSFTIEEETPCRWDGQKGNSSTPTE